MVCILIFESVGGGTVRPCHRACECVCVSFKPGNPVSFAGFSVSISFPPNPLFSSFGLTLADRH